MNCSFKQAKETATLFISGPMTIEDAAQLKTTLVDALAASFLIEIDLSATDTIDLSCLQVLCSAHRAAVHAGKKLFVRRKAEALISCLEDAGFPRHSGCFQQEVEPCLWQEVKQP
jgi:ABC-type transporter Mla MlaB component